MTLASRVKYRMNELGMNPAQVSKAAGFAPTFVRDLIEGRKKSVRADSLKSIAEVLGVTPEWLNGAGALQRSGGAIEPNRSTDEIQTIPIFDIDASAGHGTFAEDGGVLGYQPFRSQQLTRLTSSPLSRLAVIMVRGDSMDPTLANQDHVLVDTTVNRVGRDGIYILALEDELLVKRCWVDLDTGAIVVKSDNPQYGTQTVTDKDRLDIKGRVIWIGRALG